MKLSSVSQFLLSPVASATPAPALRQDPALTIGPFGLLSLRSASPVHFGQVSAAFSSIFINLPQQNAICDGDSHNVATFWIYDGSLFLYGREGTPLQQIYVDRSEAGQGKVGYINWGEQPPNNAFLTGWTIDGNSNLQFHGAEFLACPNAFDGAWFLWAAGYTNPGGNMGCLGVKAQTFPIKAPVACDYSQ